MFGSKFQEVGKLHWFRRISARGQSSVKIKVILRTTHMAKEERDVFGGDKYRIHKDEAGGFKDLRDVVTSQCVFGNEENRMKECGNKGVTEYQQV